MLFPTSLQEAYDNATSLNGYDKYLILNPDSTYPEDWDYMRGIS